MALDITMVQNRKKLRKNSHLIIHFPTSSGVSEVSERASEQANGRVSGSVLQSQNLYSWLFWPTVHKARCHPIIAFVTRSAQMLITAHAKSHLSV